MLFTLLVAIFVAVFVRFQDADFLLFITPYKESKNNFKNEVVWITGASSGIGRSFAEDMVREGALTIISARNKTALEEVAAQCTRLFGSTPFVLPLDVTDIDAQARAVDTVTKKFGPVNILVLNAGRSQRNTAQETPLSDTEEIMQLNFVSQVSLAMKVLPSMKTIASSARTQLVVVSSVSGIIPSPIGTSYSASKFALQGYFNALRSELSIDNITVTTVLPGPVESNIVRNALANKGYQRESEGKKMPTKRCTALMTRGIFYEMSELWIAENPFLFFTYLQQYFPALMRTVFSRIAGPGRIRALREGGDCMSASGIIWSYFQPYVAATAKGM